MTFVTEAKFEGPQKCTCRHADCDRGRVYEQYDHYGIYAGKMSDHCFERSFKQGPYFDAGYAGESLDAEPW